MNCQQTADFSNSKQSNEAVPSESLWFYEYQMVPFEYLMVPLISNGSISISYSSMDIEWFHLSLLWFHGNQMVPFEVNCGSIQIDGFI